MKKLLNLLCVISCLAFVACADDLKPTEQPGDNTDQTENGDNNENGGENEDENGNIFTMTVSGTDVVLEETNHAQEAISITWTTGTNYGTGNKITYSLELTANETTVVALEPTTEVYSLSMTVEQLNQYVVKNFNAQYGDAVTIGIKLTASVADHPEYDQVQTGSVNVTTYQPLPSTLFIIGDATKTGWSLDNAQELTRVDNGEFTATVKLSAAGAFKFVVSRGGFEPGYNRAGEDNTKLVYRATTEDPDEQFRVAEDGVYELKLNLFDLTISIVKTEAEIARFDDVYFVGAFTGWLFERMNADPLAMNMWYYGRVLQSGADGTDFKFGTIDDGSWSNMLTASETGAPITSTGVVFNGDDNKWTLTSEQLDKAYKIYLDVTSGKEKMLMSEFTGFDGVWMVGDATPNGWDLGQATALTAGDNFTYTWSGNLKAGELKFSCDKQEDWMGRWFMSSIGNKTPSGEEEVMVYLDKSDVFYVTLYPEINVKDLDFKWKITEAGAYTVSLNALTHRVTIAKQ